jgi:hypothetical protein
MPYFRPYAFVSLSRVLIIRSTFLRLTSMVGAAPFVVCLFMLIVGGCASDCSLMAKNDSPGCDVRLLGTVLMAIPSALIEHELQQKRQEAYARELLPRLGNKEPDALRECVISCDILLIEMEDKRAIRLQAARDFVALDGDSLAPGDVLPMLTARNLLSVKTEADGRVHVISGEVERAGKLSRGVSAHQAVASNDHFLAEAYRRESVKVVANEFLLSHVMDHPEYVGQAFEKCISDITRPRHPLLGDWNQLVDACSTAYLQLNSKAPPWELYSRWHDAARGKE